MQMLPEQRRKTVGGDAAGPMGGPSSGVQSVLVSQPDGTTHTYRPPTMTQAPGGVQFHAPTPVLKAAPAPVGPTMTPARTQPTTATVPPQGQPAGQGAMDPLQALLGRIYGAANQGLDQPTVYDDPLFQAALGFKNQQIGDQFQGLRDQLDTDLAGRGLTYSSVAGTGLRDLATAQSFAQEQAANDLLRERAMALASGRQGALQNALGVMGFDQGQRSAADASDADLLQMALGYGSNPDIYGLSSLLGSGASQYGQQAGETNDQLAALAAAAAQLFGLGGNKGG